MPIPAVIVALPLLAGAACGILLIEQAPERLVAAASCAAVLCLLAGACLYSDEFTTAFLAVIVLGTAAAGYASGTARARDLHAPPLLTWFEGTSTSHSGPPVLVGRLRNDVAVLGYGALLTVDVREVSVGGTVAVGAEGGVRLTVGGLLPPAAVNEWRAGRLVRVPAALRRPITFSNPGVPDDAKAMARRGVVLNGSVKSAALVEILEPGTWISERAAALRAWTRRMLALHVGRHDARSGAVATAILIGDRTGLGEEDERRLQDAGTYHVIAISGGNIAILTALLVLGGRALRIPYRAAALLSIAVLLFYGEVAGGAASVGRAITAAVIFLTALALDQRGAPLNVLAVAAVLAVGYDPAAVLDGGFLLSFGATAGIMLGVPRLVRLAPDHRVGGAARLVRVLAAATAGVLAATVCAEVVLAPIGASLFSRITFAGLALNFAAIPLMTMVQCGAMILLAAAAVGSGSAEAIGVVVHYAAYGLVESSRLVTFAPWLARDVPPPSWWLCAAYYGLCVTWLFVRRMRRVVMAALATAMAVLVTGASPSADGAAPPLQRGSLRLVVLDVAQGDATVALLPSGHALLVDAGGLPGTTFDIGGRVVVPALRALGVRRLHALVLTHGDPDHIAGAEAVMRRIPTANVWEGVPVPPHPALKGLRAFADETGTVWRTLRPTDLETAGAVDIRVLHPPIPDWERQRVRNDDSVVLELRYGDVSIVLPGDIGAVVEHTLGPQLQLGPLSILKAAHHGSATSSSESFIDAVRPRAVIFSAGRNNRFGHPAPAVVERFVRRGVEMFNTGHDGAVFVDTDGRHVEVRGWETGKTMTATAEHDGTTTRRHD